MMNNVIVALRGNKMGLRLIIVGVGILVTFGGCGHKTKQDQDNDDLSVSKSKMVVDESLQPIVDEELYVFKALYPNLHPEVAYAPENNAVNMLLNYDVQFALLSRDLNAQERSVLAQRRITPIVSRFALDAVTLIVNKASKDTTIKVSEIKRMLNSDANTSKSTDNTNSALNHIKSPSADNKTVRNIVFDNPNSGLVRYLKDFAGNADFKQKNIYSLKSNKEVIKYVSEHPDAIGITGFGWLNDPDKDYAAAVGNVKIVSVMDDVTKNARKQYFTPSQTTLALKQYPLVRNLYVLDCTGRRGLAYQFAAFILSDRGQRIILKSGLLPDSIPNRVINIRKKILQ